MKKHQLNKDQFDRLANPYYYTISMTCVESMPIGMEDEIKASLVPYNIDDDEYLTEIIVCSYDSYIEDETLNGSPVDYDDIHFFGMEKSSAIDGIGKDSNIFIIRDVESDYNNLGIKYKENDLTEHISKRFELSELSAHEFILRETFADLYRQSDIEFALMQFLLEEQIVNKYKIQREAYGYIVLINI